MAKKKDSGKKKLPPRKNGPKNVAKKAAAPTNETEAERRVAFLRHKLTQAMEDPLTREQIVRALRAMLMEGRQ